MGMLKGEVLLIDDDVDVLHTAKMILKPHFQNVTVIENPEKIEELMILNEFDVIILDMNFSFGQTSGKEGIFWLRKILAINPETHVVMNTAYGDIQIAVDAMKEGAIDFLVKPWEKEKLLATVSSVYKLSQIKKENKSLRNTKKILSEEIDQKFPDILSKAKSMVPVFEAINKVAQTDANVLILGENGTGKELVARMIHRKSLRIKNDFVSVDLGAISESLFESELFGHKKGSFTDANEDRTGRFEIAQNGTLFLDEIGNLSLPLQSKLLAALQNREVCRVGSSQPIPIDIRLICATNKPIYQMVVANEFRQDLLYRINTVEINLPPLRNRVEDIILLAAYFLRIYSKKYNKPAQTISTEAIKKMQQYHWPGNIRELQHIIERAVILNPDSELTASSFPLDNRPNQEVSDKIDFKITNLEKATITNALKECRGNMTLAAKELGYGRSTLYRKMRKYGI